MKLDKFRYNEADEIKISQCVFCKHKQSGTKCKAFERIPNEILNNEFDHRIEYPNDNNIQFEANDGVEQETIDKLFE